jgi:hypothetical protein
VVQLKRCFAKRKACSTVKRRRYQRQIWCRSSGNSLPIHASQSGAGHVELWQVLDLHTEHRKRSRRRILDVQAGPGVHGHGAIHRVLQTGWPIGWTMRAGVLELQDRTVLMRPPAASVRLRSTAEDTVLG